MEAAYGLNQCGICGGDFVVEKQEKASLMDGTSIVATLALIAGVIVGFFAIASSGASGTTLNMGLLTDKVVNAIAAFALIAIGCTGKILGRLDIIAHRLQRPWVRPAHPNREKVE